MRIESIGGDLRRDRIVHCLIPSLVVFLWASAGAGQLVATDVTAADIRAALEAAPRDAVSDRPIRVVDVGGYNVGVYLVHRPKISTQRAISHAGTVSEVYYMLKGAGTLVTGGTLEEPQKMAPPSRSTRGSGIRDGVSRRVAPGDVVVIPPTVPHWWSELETDVTYLIVRPDPEAVLSLK